MDREVLQISKSESALLERIRAGLPITADVSRADLLLHVPSPLGARVVAQARPRSISSLYSSDRVGQVSGQPEQPLVFRALEEGRAGSAQQDLPTGTPVVQEVYPVHNNQGRTIAALSVETNLIAHERHRRRHRSFQRAVRWLQGMAIRGTVDGAAALSPFGEWDGILYVDAQRRIVYLSGIANNLYRRLGYLLDLRGTLLGDLQTGDDKLVRLAMESERCQEEERQEGRRLWNRKVVPLRPVPPSRSRRWRMPWEVPSSEVAGALVMVHDLTDERLRDQELRLKATMIQEVHHRVKNNLQAVASLLRMQARRMELPEARKALDEAVGRILSVSVIHEFLSQAEDQLINIRDVCHRIVTQVETVVIAPEREIRLQVRGPSLYLPSRQATACALVVNELLENALEHGLQARKSGAVTIRLHDGGDVVSISVQDEDAELPEEFEPERGDGLGLYIVRTLVEEELRGQFELRGEPGVSAVITFPKRSSLT
jgi:two-component sensor histidine kinase